MADRDALPRPFPSQPIDVARGWIADQVQRDHPGWAVEYNGWFWTARWTWPDPPQRTPDRMAAVRELVAETGLDGYAALYVVANEEHPPLRGETPDALCALMPFAGF